MKRQVVFVFCCLVIAFTEAHKKISKRANSANMCRLETVPLFTCDNGDCILRSWYCDGSDDCDDSSDELNCKDHVCDPRLVIPCGDGTCRPLSYRCDGSKDCKTGADEKGCPANRDFTCADGSVVKGGLQGRCDAWPDCYDDSDEANCQDYQCHPVLQMTCASDNSCRPNYYICDGESDCPDGEDEEGCDY